MLSCDSLSMCTLIISSYTDISCLGGVFAKKYQSRDEKFSESNGEGNLVSRLVFFANTPPKRDISV
jgi:hypothetical protein